MRQIIILLALCASAFAQDGMTTLGVGYQFLSGSSPITLDASCTGSGTSATQACGAWTPNNPSVGDTIVCPFGGVSGGNNETGTVFDTVNGFYDNTFGSILLGSSLSWVSMAVFQNSASGSITPQILFSSSPLSRGTISCYAFKSTATSLALDNGSVNQTTSASVTNPTSGTAAAPNSNNEVVVANMWRNNSTAPSSGGGCWLPSGTLSVVGGSGMRQSSEYCIQTTATAENGPFTGNTTAQNTVDSQLAILQSGTPGGTRSFTGVYVPFGAPGSAPTGTTSAALIGASTSTLSSVHLGPASPYWTLGGTAPTYDTSVVITGTRHIMVQGVDHIFGDAGATISVAGGTTSGYYSTTDDIGGLGTPHLYSFSYQMASSGATTNQGCDDGWLSGAVTEGQMITQVDYATGSTYSWHLEGSENDGSQQSTPVNFDVPYRFELRLAGVNERNHTFNTYSKSGSTWSLIGTLQEDVLCSNGANLSCGAGTTTSAGPPATATQTGTASSGSTALTLGSGTGTANGQVALDLVGNCIPSPLNGSAWTLVESGGGTTSITLSQNTTCPISSTNVSFYTKPAGLSVATNCSVTAGSTAMTCVTPGTGTISTGQAMGGTGIFQGTKVSAVSLPSVTLTIPATQTTTNAGVNFWSSPSSSGFAFGKDAGGSCGITSKQNWGDPLYDPYNDWGAGAFN